MEGVQRVIEVSISISTARVGSWVAVVPHRGSVAIAACWRGANTAAFNSVIADTGAAILMRQCKCLHNIVERDHRAVKRVTRQMLGFKNFHCAQSLIAAVESMHMILKGQMKSGPEGQVLSKAEQFYSLAF